MAEVPDAGSASAIALPDTLPGRYAPRGFHPGGGYRPVALILLLAFTLAAPVHAADTSRAEPAAKLQQLRERIGALRSEIASTRDERDSVQQSLEKADKEIGVTRAALRGLDQQAGEARAAMQELQREFELAQLNLEKTRKILAKDLQLAYVTGKQEQIKLLLNQQDPAALGRLMVYHEYFVRARAQTMDEIQATLQRLDGLQRKMQAQRGEIEELIGRQQEKSAQLTARQEQRRALLAQLQERLSSKTDQLAVLQEDEQRLQKLVQSLQQAIRDLLPEGGGYVSLQSLKGKLRWPVAGRISVRYGQQHALGKLHSRGVHIASRAGADVRVIARGRVVFADWLRGFGLLMIVDHGDNYMSLYGQNSSLYREVGDWVDRNEVIAAAGSSGGRMQSGLYLELRKDGRPLNPAGWFSGTPDTS